MLSYAPLEAGLDIWERVGLDRLEIASPHAAQARDSQVTVRHVDGYSVIPALIDRGVIGGFRAPDLMRFGFAQLYARHRDVGRAVQILRDPLITEAWRSARYAVRAQVT
ncbi:hypothetical protein AV521_05030 [Streptomyces sp. IMTB 2501]|uniref:kynureninase/PvdN C-terminal domain-containing protein n=1 Tax=Streptomyces sp. IMTB 2501 TaxID=1776340 RepID=UPI00096BFB48|nr:hypothetical protein [Streptomyces sp. IMTB 2501]OLZ73436.1 hypothetical protein AV521_05030 [Streptomyces sp. IMTB 2501]